MLDNIENMETIEVYVYYDGVQLYSCRDRKGNIYLAAIIDQDKAGEEWIYAPVTRGRLDAIESGTVDLHDAFSKAEGGVVYRVRISYESETTKIMSVGSSELDVDELPLKNERLSDML